MCLGHKLSSAGNLPRACPSAGRFNRSLGAYFVANDVRYGGVLGMETVAIDQFVPPLPHEQQLTEKLGFASRQLLPTPPILQIALHPHKQSNSGWNSGPSFRSRPTLVNQPSTAA